MLLQKNVYMFLLNVISMLKIHQVVMPNRVVIIRMVVQRNRHNVVVLRLTVGVLLRRPLVMDSPDVLLVMVFVMVHSRLHHVMVRMNQVAML